MNTGKKKKEDGRNFELYSVYDLNGNPLVEHATADVCAEEMNIKVQSFYSRVARGDKYKPQKWVIVKENSGE